MSESGVTGNSVNPPEERSAPMVSIGMPVYNGEKYLREALDSLLAQTFLDFELIISDNASTDDTQDICLEYESQDSRIRYIRQDVNQGATFNFKFVLTEAIGTFFMWASHDDAWGKNWLEVLVAGIAETDIAIRGLTKIVDSSGNLLGIPTTKSFKKMAIFRVFFDNEKNGKAFYIYGLFWREKLLSIPFGILENNVDAADVIYISVLAQHGDLRCIGETFQYYRSHEMGEGAAQSRGQNQLLRIICLAHNLDFYKYHIKTAPKQYQLLMAVLSPIKMLKTQMELWSRGLRYLVFRRRKGY
jgi:glycosyltransferase involved in cell wall biosynthesis